MIFRFQFIVCFGELMDDVMCALGSTVSLRASQKTKVKHVGVWMSGTDAMERAAQGHIHPV